MKRLEEAYKAMLPFEKYAAYGFESLSDEELLAVIIRSGTKNCSCMDAAAGIIRKTKGQGIIGLWELSVKELSALPGIGTVKAVQLKSICELSRRMARQTRRERAVFRTSRDVVDYLMEDMRHLVQEQLRLLILDTKCRLIHETVISVGTANSTVMSPRQICRETLMHDGISFIMAHNHPTGDPSPSKEDIMATARVKQAAELIGVTLIDHIIIGDNTYISMKDNNILEH